MTTEKYKELTVGEIVANDFRAANIFKNAGIDFCCGGKKGLLETCREKGIDTSKLEIELQGLDNLPENPIQNFKEWEPDFLCDYIVNTHHKFVLKNLPELVYYTQKIASVHGDHHPELIKIAGFFSNINEELLQHLRNEEEVLFPAIKEVKRNGSPEAKQLIIKETSRMIGEHELAGSAMDEINKISKNYTVPADGCNTYHVTFKTLQQFEDDLHVHVHLENNILYPKAIAMTN
jgi:regulator of cell morphogenesis and NO signaling